MEARGGLYWRLKDPSLTLAERVKLVRYAWKSTQVHIPNKEQVLLDWICLELSGKQRVGVDQAMPVWRCLHDVLRTQRCHKTSQHGHHLVIKPALYQVILEHLQKCSQKRTDMGDVIISCAHSLLTSPNPHLNYPLTSNYESMFRLLSAILRLCSEELLHSRLIPSDRVLLLEAAMGRCIARGNPQQVITHMSSQLLPSAMLFIHAVSKEEVASEHSASWVKQLDNILSKALFSSDLAQYYDTYLRSKVDESTKSGTVLPKFIISLFKVLMSQDPDSVVTYLPHFYRGFDQAYSSDGHVMSYKLLVYLAGQLDLKADGKKGQGQFSAASSLNGLAALLKEACSLEIYQPSVDLTNGGKQLKWLQLTAGKLLQNSHKTRGHAWFSCLHSLFSLSHSTLEPHLADLLLHGWVVHQAVLDPPAKLIQGQLFQDVVYTYARLRQLPKLAQSMMEALRLSTSPATIEWPSSLSESLSASFTSMPQTSCLELWENLHTELVSHYLPQIESTDSVQASSVCGACDLASLFLRHIKVADHSVTAQTQHAVEQLMEKMAAEFLAPALKQLVGSVQDVSIAAALLHLAWSWGDLALLCAHYSHDDNAAAKSIKDQVKKVSGVHDLSAVHSYLTAKEWAQLHKALKRSESHAVKYVWNLCLAQKLQACLLFGEGQVDVAAMREVAMILVSELSQECSAVWNGKYASVCADSAPVSAWHLVCTHISTILPFCETSQVGRIALGAVAALCREKEALQAGDCSVRSLCLGMLESSSFHESFSMQTALVTALWARMGEQLSTTKKSPKKPKKSGSVVGGALSMLCSEELDWNTKAWPSGGDLGHHLKELGCLIGTAMKAEISGRILSEKQHRICTRCLKILQLLPLEYLSPVNRTRCILGVLVLLGDTRGTVKPAGQDSLYDISQEILECLLDVAHGSQIFSLVNSADLCWYLLELQSPTHGENMCTDRYGRIMTTLVRLASKETASLTALAPCILKVTEKLKVDELAAVCPSLLQTAVCMAQVLTKVVQKPTLKDDIKDVCEEQVELLHTSLLKLHKQLLKAPPDVMFKLLALSLEGFAVIVDSDSRKEENLTGTKLSKLIISTCGICLQLFTNNQQICQSHNGVLVFIRTLSEHHVKLRDFLPEKFMQKIWSTLLQHLYRSKENRNQQPTQQSMPSHKYRNQILNEILGTCVDRQCTSMDVYGSNEESEAQKPVSMVMPAKQEVMSTLVTVISTFTAEEFQGALLELMENVDVQHSEFSKVSVAVEIWTQLLEVDLDEAKLRVLQLASQNMLLRFLPVCSDLQNRPTQAAAAVLVDVYQCHTKMLTFGKNFLSPQCVSLCIHACQYAPVYALTREEDFAAVFYAVYNVLNEALMHHSDTIFKTVPPFLAAAKRLMLSLIQRADQNAKWTSEKDLIGCAHLVDRLFALLLTHKVEFARVAPYIIADYVSEIQKVTLLPKVKRALVPAIYQLFDMCDQHSIALLQTNLNVGVREVFKTLHEEYTKYYKYSGKI